MYTFIMVDSHQIGIYRFSVVHLLQTLRYLMFIESKRTSYPTDSSIAYLLGLSPTAFSSISRSCASMSGITLQKLMFEIAKRSAPGDFATTMSEFVSPYLPV